MEEKYYTPTVEEFHVGLEYESYDSCYSYEINPIGNGPNGSISAKVLSEPKLVNVWNKNIYQVNDFVIEIDGESKFYYNSTNLRVKYLDREDIESLGWDHDQTTKDGAVFYIGTLMDEQQWMLTAENARLSKGNDYTKIQICDINNTFDNYFDGVVKNKSELKKLMKMLGIK